MNILALSASGSRASLTYRSGGRDLYTVEAARTIQPSIWLPRTVRDIQSALPRMLAGLDIIAVDAGPGSFTGIKVAISFAQGLAATGGMKLATVDSLEAAAILPPGDRPIVVLRNAHQGKAYAATYERARDAVPCSRSGISVLETGDLHRYLDDVGTVHYLVADELPRFESPRSVPLDTLPPLSLGVALLAERTAAERCIAPKDVRPVYMRTPELRLPSVPQAVASIDSAR